MIVIAVIGSKKSGKTTTIEALVKDLTKRGYSVATVKHISEHNFTLDTERKDTWRHTRAGAKTAVIVAPKEVGIIKKIDTSKLRLKDVIGYVQNNIDIVILEGFRNIVEHEPTIPKIVSIKTSQEAVEALKRFRPVIVFTGLGSLTAKELGIPVIDVLEEPERLVEVVLSKI